MRLFRKEAPRFTSVAYADVAVLTLGAKRYYHDSQQDFLDALREARAKSGAGKIVVDLAKVELISSACLGPMCNMHRTLLDQGGGIVVAGAKAFAQEILSFADVPVEAFEDVPAALRSDLMAGEAATIYAQEN